MGMAKRYVLWLTAAITAGVSGFVTDQPAHADPLAVVAGEALDVSAEQLNVDIEAGRAVLEGSVSVTLGELRVQCPRVEIGYDAAPTVRWAKGSGGVHAELRGIIADAAVVRVDVQQRRVNLAGGVKLARGRGWVHADEATIDIKTRHVTLHDVKGSIPVNAPNR